MNIIYIGIILGYCFVCVFFCVVNVNLKKILLLLLFFVVFEVFGFLFFLVGGFCSFYFLLCILCCCIWSWIFCIFRSSVVLGKFEKVWVWWWIRVLGIYISMWKMSDVFFEGRRFGSIFFLFVVCGVGEFFVNEEWLKV